MPDTTVIDGMSGDHVQTTTYPASMMEWAIGPDWNTTTIQASGPIIERRTGIRVSPNDMIDVTLRKVYERWKAHRARLITPPIGPEWRDSELLAAYDE